MPDLAAQLRGYVDAIGPPTDLDLVLQRVASAHRRRARVRLALGVAAAAVLLLVTVLVASGRDRGDELRVVDGPGLGAPALFVAGAEDGRLAVFDARSGRRVRHLTAEEPGGGAGSPAVTADGRFVYFNRGLGSCASAIDRLDLHSGETARVVGADDAPPVSLSAIAPDGGRLAYVTSSCTQGEDAVFVVRDLTTGVEQTYSMGNPPAVASAAFSPGGDHLAYAYVDGGGVAYDVHVLDLDTATSLDGRNLELSRRCGARTPAFLGDGTLLVTTCDADDATTVVVAAFDPVTGERLRTVVAVPGVSHVESVWDLDVTSNGERLLVETEHGVFWSDDSELSRVNATGAITSPTWLPDTTDDTSPTTSTSELPTTTSSEPASQPPELDAGRAAEASALVAQFLDLLASDDLEAAAALWSGYGNPFGGEDEADAKITALEQLQAEHGWLTSGSPPEISVTPSFGFTVADPVVTVLSAAQDGLPRHAAAFLVSPGGAIGPAGPLRIQRIPEPEPDDLDVVAPASGSPVSPRDPVVVGVMPVEGGATAHINGVEVPVTADYDTLTISFDIPGWARDEVVITMSVATPELPVVLAFWYPVRSP